MPDIEEVYTEIRDIIDYREPEDYGNLCNLFKKLDASLRQGNPPPREWRKAFNDQAGD